MATALRVGIVVVTFRPVFESFMVTLNFYVLALAAVLVRKKRNAVDLKVKC